MLRCFDIQQTSHKRDVSKRVSWLSRHLKNKNSSLKCLWRNVCDGVRERCELHAGPRDLTRISMSRRIVRWSGDYVVNKGVSKKNVNVARICLRAREKRLQLGLSSSCCRVPVSNVPATRHLSPSRVKGNIMVTNRMEHEQNAKQPLIIVSFFCSFFVSTGQHWSESTETSRLEWWCQI